MEAEPQRWNQDINKPLHKQRVKNGIISKTEIQNGCLRVVMIKLNSTKGIILQITPKKMKYSHSTKNVFDRPKDCANFGKGKNAKKYIWTDSRVERVQRAHLYKNENIMPFLNIGLQYYLSHSDPSTVIPHFRCFLESESVT